MASTMSPGELHQLLQQACPIESVVMEDAQDTSTWRFIAAAGATDAQRDAAQAILDQFDPSLHEAATAVKAEVSRRLLAHLKDSNTQLNMLALASAITAKILANAATQEERDTLAALVATQAWIETTLASGRTFAGAVRNGTSLADLPWPEAPAGLDDIVNRL